MDLNDTNQYIEKILNLRKKGILSNRNPNNIGTTTIQTYDIIFNDIELMLCALEKSETSVTLKENIENAFKIYSKAYQYSLENICPDREVLDGVNPITIINFFISQQLKDKDIGYITMALPYVFTSISAIFLCLFDQVCESLYTKKKPLKKIAEFETLAFGQEKLLIAIEANKNAYRWFYESISMIKGKALNVDIDAQFKREKELIAKAKGGKASKYKAHKELILTLINKHLNASRRDPYEVSDIANDLATSLIEPPSIQTIYRWVTSVNNSQAILE